MTSSAKGGGGFQIMTADDGGGGIAENDVIFYNHFWAKFQKYEIINFHKRAISELKRIRDRSYLT